MMRRVHIVGRKNHGKTTLVVELVAALSRLGLKVGTIKHTHHHHELDTPGKDSHRHREAGAVASGVFSRTLNAVFWPPAIEASGESSAGDQKYASFEPMFAQCDIVVVEGDSQTSATKVEVWRAAVAARPLACDDPEITAVISDDPLPDEASVEAWSRKDIDFIAQQVWKLASNEMRPRVGGSDD